MHLQRKRPQLLNLSVTPLLLLVAFVATVASVPTSVLVQNSELASNANNANNKNNNNNNNPNVIMAKVKRSSGNKESGNVALSSANLNKKSSPEIVPASFNAPPPQRSASSTASADMAAMSLPTNDEILNSAIAAGLTAAAVEAANQRDLDMQQTAYGGDELYGNRAYEEAPTMLHKRGISSQQYLYSGADGYGGNSYGGNSYGNNDMYNPYSAPSSSLSSSAAYAAMPNGIWANDMDPAAVYNDLQDLQDDYVPAARAPTYRNNKAYDNLQSLLNSETYLEPVVLPLQYNGRYYGGLEAERDRSKRSNLSKFNKFTDMRLKRDTKLTPADMLALVALVEAGERARTETDADAGYLYPPVDAYAGAKIVPSSSYYPSAPVAAAAAPYEAMDEDYNQGAWLEPAMVDYYGLPVNMETMPKYELAREHKYGSNTNRFSSKRFMVAKKKRSMGKFLNEPVAKPSISFGENIDKYY